MKEFLVVVVDDNQEIRAFLEKNVLAPAGYRVKSTDDGLLGLQLAHDLNPDLVITDQQMPNLTGTELIQRLQREKPQLPVILMTSEGSERLVVEALRAGAVDYMTKPFEAEYMLAAVGRALVKAQQWRLLTEARSEAQVSAESLERRLKELETLALIGRTVTAVLDLDEVLTTVVDAAVRLSEAEEGSLLLLDEDSGELYMRASRNFDEDFATAFRIPSTDSLAGQVIASGEPIILDLSSPQKIKTAYLVHSLIYVPLRVRGHVIGVLGVDNRKAGRILTQHDMTIMAAIADYAAIAIENAQLYNWSEAERSKLGTILRQTENGVVVVDPENRLVLINRAAKEAFNVEGDFLGRSIVEAFDEPKLLALLRAEEEIPRREEIETPDSRVFSAQRTVIEGVGQAIIMHDITHFKNLDHLKSEFVTTVSHDLRSPLTSILGYVDLLERVGPINEKQHEFIRRVRLSVGQITNLITDLLDLGRIEAGLDIAHEETPIVLLARYAVESLRGMAEERGVKIETDLPKELPLVNGDPIRLRQMIGNLLDNAIKYTPAGGVVRVEAKVERSQVILHVSDTGPGIHLADVPYLFDKFFRARNVPQDIPGTGLGLSIVKSIVDNHGGRIWVESKIGEGTTFTVVLEAVIS